VSASASASSTSTATSADNDSSSSDEGTDGTDGSTGEPTTDWALQFDGTSYARMADIDDSFTWPSSDFTVEVWAEIHDTDATGIIFDTANVQFQDGWVLYLHSEYDALVFSFFDENHQNAVVMGPTVEEIGTGWHHFAATKADGEVFIHVDGMTTTQEQVPSTLSFDNTALWSLGGSPDDNVDFRLTNVTIDDIRISGFARYQTDFDPLPAYDDDESVILLLRLDAGEGDVVIDEISAADFAVENPRWVPGNTG